MTGITTTGLGLPTPQSLFASGGVGTAPAPATALAPASTTPVNGPTVVGPGGMTALPSASPADFQGVNPTPLDQPHPQYPQLIQSHVAVLQAIGTPANVIAQLAATSPAADYLDRYIQGEIMQNPEGWDAYVGNPAGTARAGLKKLMPNTPLPAPGQGTPGVMPDGGRVDGINVPGITQPLVGPQQSSGEALVKGLVFTAAAVGVGLLAWKFIKNRNVAKEAVQIIGSTDQAQGLLAGVAAGEGTAGANGVRRLLEAVKGGGGAALGGQADEAGLAAQKLLAMQAMVGGGVDSAGSNLAASLDLFNRNLGVVDGYAAKIGNAALAYNQPYMRMASVVKQGEMIGVLKQATQSGQLAELVAAAGLLSQAGQQAATTAGTAAKNAGTQQLLAGISHLIG